MYILFNSFKHYSNSIGVCGINLISIVTNTDVTAYNKNFPLLMIDAIISKTLYLFTCIILARFIKKEKTNKNNTIKPVKTT